MPVEIDITKTAADIIADNKIDQHEHDIAVDALKVLAGENAELRVECKALRKDNTDLRDEIAEIHVEHDKQMQERDKTDVQIILGIFISITITLFGILNNFDLEMIDIGLSLLPVLGLGFGTATLAHFRHSLKSLFNIVAGGKK